MRRFITYATAMTLLAAFLHCTGCEAEKTIAPSPQPVELTQVADFGQMQCTGVAVTNGGRVFVCFPRWSDTHGASLVEVLPDGTTVPYPDKQWNSWSPGDDTRKSFVCLQSVWADPADPAGSLWVLDAGNPKFAGVLPNAAKLVRIDLATNAVTRIVRFGAQGAPAGSYLNDVRIDAKRRFAYLTDSGLGALVVVNLRNDRIRRVLIEHASTKAEPDTQIVIGDVPLLNADGKTPKIHADGLAIDAAKDFVYYKALTGQQLYRLPAKKLRNFSMPDRYIDDAVESLGDYLPSDGMTMDASGNLYLTAITQNAIVRRTPDGKLDTIVSDDRIIWPDAVAISPSGDLYFTISQINLIPRFNQGVDKRTAGYKLFKVRSIITPEK